MDLDRLQDEWRQLDDKVQAGLRLDARLLREVTAARLDGYLRRELWRMLPLLLLDVLAVLWLGSFFGDHLRAPRFALPALLLLAFAVFVLAGEVRQLALVLGVDHAAPVLAGQRRLERLKLARTRHTMRVLLLAPLLWTPLLIVALAALFDIDAYRLLGPLNLAVNLGFSVVLVALVRWLARRLGARLAGRPWLRRLADDLAGRNLTAALRYLGSLAAFEAELDDSAGGEPELP